MLRDAFIETSDYSHLSKTRDFNFVVGRRGTGKSALFAKLHDSFCNSKDHVIYAPEHQEHDTVALGGALAQIATNYHQIRVVARILWKVDLLIACALRLNKHYKARVETAFFEEYFRRHSDLLVPVAAQRCLTVLKSVGTVPYEEISSTIAATCELDGLRRNVENALDHSGIEFVVLFDRLDEGWLPEIVPTAILGGLAKAVAELVESHDQFYPLLFVRDNIFRALAELDTDFTRNIQDNTIRLHWQEASLFHLVTKRLRLALDLDIESDVKVWNRFAQRELEGREGFRKTLQSTLYRPRDIISLLNEAYIVATREGRTSIVPQDIDAGAGLISRSRLDDLLKEYERVFPGLGLVVKRFQGAPAVARIESLLEILSRSVEQEDFSQQEASDFAIFESARDLLFALYSVGFIGVGTRPAGPFVFRHDGARTGPQDLGPEMFATIHPCYWQALTTVQSPDANALVIEINDENEVKVTPEVPARRTAMLGVIAQELPKTRMGAEGASDFEKWVLRAIKVLFAGRLANPELKPNPGSIQQRDVVATNVAERGFWKRVRDDYKTRQVIFECKNFAELGADDFRQVLSYTSGQYGTFAVVVARPDKEFWSDAEKNWMRELYLNHGRLIMPIAAQLMSRAVSKLRNVERKDDYMEGQLNGKLDDIERKVVNIASSRTGRRSRR